MALDTLRAALWLTPDVALVCTGRRLHGWRGCPVCAKLHHWRCRRWVHLGLAADCGGVVCTVDHVSANYGIIPALWKCGKLPLMQMVK